MPFSCVPCSRAVMLPSDQYLCVPVPSRLARRPRKARRKVLPMSWNSTLPESTLPLTPQDIIHLQRAFSHDGPTPECIDEVSMSDTLFAARRDGYSHLYYALGRLRCASALRAAGVDGLCADRFLVTSHLLDAKTLTVLGLMPLDPYALAFVLLPYWRARYAQHYPEDVWAFFNPYSRKQQGAVLTPSTRQTGAYQITYFDREGFSYHETRPSAPDALIRVLSAHYRNPNPDLLETLALHWRIPEW